MRSRAPLALMEQAVMVLVFALAAALCVQAFALSGTMSRKNEARDRALRQAQNAVETLKSTRGDYQSAADALGGNWDGEAWTLPLDADFAPAERENAAYLVKTTPKPAGNTLLGTADVIVCTADGETLAELLAAWQTEG